MGRKFYFFSILIVLTLFVKSFGQDVLKEGADLSKSVSDELPAKPDKGRAVQEGLFFTKSVYQASSEMSKLGNDRQKLSKTFEATLDNGGDFFFAANILPANNVEKISQNTTARKDTEIDIVEVRVFVNEKFVGTLKQTKLEWELVPLNETKTIRLQSGKNSIRFEADPPCFPMVDAVRITETEKNLMFENKEYNDFVSFLKASSASRTLSVTKETQEEIDKKGLQIASQGSSLKSALNPGNYDWQVYPQQLSNPYGGMTFF